MYKSFVYRLYPSKIQAERLETLLEIARTFYNAALQERKEAWQGQHITLHYYEQAKQLKEIRATNPEYALLNNAATQNVLRRLEKAFKRFFYGVKTGQKTGYPRFKSKDRFNVIIFPVYGDGAKLHENGRFYVKNVGEIKIKMHRTLEGQIRTVTIKRKCGKWYADFCNLVELNPLPYSDKQIGIDVGLKSFAVTSDREVIENPRYLREAEAALRRAQRKLSRRKIGGQNRRKARLLYAKHHEKVHNQRKDFAHKLARKIVDAYGFIAVEDLKINNMAKNHNLAQSVLDAAWGMFLDILAFEAEEAKRQFTRTIRDGSTSDCSRCGTKVPKTLHTRTHYCPSCGIVLPRDFNSALNILARGRRVWGLTCGNSQCVPQETVSVS